jgi:Arc/MetJ family transcription regulator
LEVHVATNLDLDDRLIDEARRVGGHRTKRAAVTAALEAYVRRAKPLRLLKHLGTVEFEPAYDYKKLRRAR